MIFVLFRLKDLPNKAKLSALEQLLELCDHMHIKHVHNYIEPKLQRDYISEMPRELILLLLTYVRPKDLYKLSQVSHYWHQIANDPILWKNICKKYSIAVNPGLANSNDEHEASSSSGSQGSHYRNNENMSYITNDDQEPEQDPSQECEGDDEMSPIQSHTKKSNNNNNNNAKQVNFNSLSDKRPLSSLIKLDLSKPIDKDDLLEENEENEDGDKEEEDEEEEEEDDEEYEDADEELEAENASAAQNSLNKNTVKLIDKFLSASKPTTSTAADSASASSAGASGGSGGSPAASPSSCSSTEPATNSNQNTLAKTGTWPVKCLFMFGEGRNTRRF